MGKVRGARSKEQRARGKVQGVKGSPGNIPHPLSFCCFKVRERLIRQERGAAKPPLSRIVS
jgi:hypothetical protein